MMGKNANRNAIWLKRIPMSLRNSAIAAVLIGMFVVKPKVDWTKLRETYRPRAANARDNQELAMVIGEMLDHLEDLHVYITVDGAYVPGYQRERPLNANPKAVARLIGPITSAGRDLEWARTRDGIGYINDLTGVSRVATS